MFLDRKVWVAAGGISALVGIGTREMIDIVTERIDRQLAQEVQVNRFSVEAVAGKPRWALVARAAGAAKGSALRWLAEEEGVSMTETVSVGDWLNDVPMFSVAGRSFAMGQAPREVKARATNGLDETNKTGGGVAPGDRTGVRRSCSARLRAFASTYPAEDPKLQRERRSGQHRH